MRGASFTLQWFIGGAVWDWLQAQAVMSEAMVSLAAWVLWQFCAGFSWRASPLAIAARLIEFVHVTFLLIRIIKRTNASLHLSASRSCCCCFQLRVPLTDSQRYSFAGPMLSGSGHFLIWIVAGLVTMHHGQSSHVGDASCMKCSEYTTLGTCMLEEKPSFFFRGLSSCHVHYVIMRLPFCQRLPGYDFKNTCVDGVVCFLGSFEIEVKAAHSIKAGMTS